MPKSLYQDEVFANYWNDRAGDAGEVYKRYVLDPLMFKLVGDFKDKTIIELGCGNGYLAPRLLEQQPKQIIMTDISKYNLQHAAEKCRDPRVSFLEQDATEAWKVEAASIDIVYSNMMLNEIEDIETPIQEAFKALKDGGVFVFSITHPAWDLFMYAQEKVGKPSNKIKELGGYFKRGFAKYLMGGDNKANPKLKDKYSKAFEVEHYQRPVADYFSQFVKAGFTVKQLLEPEPTAELLQVAPRFIDHTDHPIGLIFYCTKPGE
jgi:ubiquinone/menaquinone biosynthesis C-methylase UbiE